MRTKKKPLTSLGDRELSNYKSKINKHPTNRYNLLLTNTTCSARIFKRLGDGDYPAFYKGEANALFL